MLYFWIFLKITNHPAAHSGGAYWGSYLMLLLLGMFYLSIGCFTSVLTRNQIIAAVLTFVVLEMARYFQARKYRDTGFAPGTQH